MKGVESIIAIILILMIVIALAALAYTWFTGVFSSLTSTAGTAVTQTTGAMTSQFTIENARGTTGANSVITVDYRNTGTQSIDENYMTAYINDQFIQAAIGANTPGPGITDAVVINTALACACTNNKCHTGTTIWILTINTKDAFQQKTQVSC